MFQKINKLWGAIVLIVAILLAGGSGAINYNDLKIEVASNSSWIAVQVFVKYTTIKQTRDLTQAEWAKWCQAGRKIKAFNTCPLPIKE